MTVADLTERELIARIRQRLAPAPSWLPVAIGDDAAVVEPERNKLDVLTVDASVEGVHFDRRWSPPSAIGHRALAVNLSDLAAMGAAPRLALLSLALPADLPIDDFEGIIEGFTTLAASEKVTVAGGNLTRSPGPLMIDVTAIGTVKRRQVMTRSGARPGDELYVTGTLGAAAAGLQILQRGADGGQTPARESLAPGSDPHLPHLTPEQALCVERYRRPTARTRAGLLAGRSRAVSACMDLSDGLADAVRQVSEASGVGATIEADQLPIDPGARAWVAACGQDPATAALAGGDDYELLFAVSPKRRRTFLAALRSAGTVVTRVGKCTPEPILQLRGADSAAVFPQGFSHFR